MLKQLKDKFSATNTEVSKWTSIQDGLLHKLRHFINGMFANEPLQNLIKISEQHAVSETSEVARGFAILSRQAAQRLTKDRESIDRTRYQLIDFQVMSADLDKLLSLYEGALGSTQTPEGDESENIAKKIAGTKAAVTRSKQGLSSLSEGLPNAWKSTGPPSPTTSSTPPLLSSTSPSKLQQQVDEEAVEGFTAEGYTPPGAKSSSREAGDVRLNSRYGWTSTASGDSESQSLTLQLSFPRDVSSIAIQSGTFRQIVTANPSAVKASNLPVVTSPLAPLPLPCGLTISTCNGAIEQTAVALADVLDWSALLKKNPPEKFLKRPPVRFLFDLVKYIGEVVLGTQTVAQAKFLPDKLLQADWDAVSASKQSKIEFMQEVWELMFYLCYSKYSS